MADWSVGGEQYAELENGLASLAGIDPSISLVVWHHGEQDTTLVGKFADYRAGLETLQNMVSTLLLHARWIVCRASYNLGKIFDDTIQAQTRFA